MPYGLRRAHDTTTSDSPCAAEQWNGVCGVAAGRHKAEKGLTSYTVYVDPDSLSQWKRGEGVGLDGFQHNTNRAVPPYLPVESQRELDCIEERIRLLALTVFSGNMGNGHAVYSYSGSNDQGVQVEPGNVAKSLWNLVCSEQ